MENLNIDTLLPKDALAVSVVLPFYNAHAYLTDAIESILSQDMESFELILVDDGSTDRSLDIAKKYKDTDARVRIITENNAGPATARNKGLARARGKYVIFLDADDFYEPTLLSSLYTMAENDGLDIAICEFDIFNAKKNAFEENVKSDHHDLLADGKVISKSEYPDYILQCTTAFVCNKLFRRDFLFENKITFNTELKIFEDVYFVSAALATAARVAKVPGVLVHHRRYSEQTRPKLFKKHYASVPDVYLEVKKYLMQHGIYAPISASFINLSASRCYTIYNILWKDAKEIFWNLLHERYLDELGWSAAPADEIESPAVRSFIATVALYNHKQYIKRQKRVTVVEDAEVNRIYERKRRIKKIRRFFKLINK